MKAARLLSPGILRIEEVSVPEPNQGELRVRPNVTLTCGTDVKTFERGHPLAREAVILGHEFCGVVDRASESAKFRQDERVVAANSAPCEACFYCQRNQPNLCENLSAAIIGFTHPGAYAEYVTVPRHIARINTYRVPEDVSDEEAAFLEPLSCVVHGMDVANVKLGESLVVLGAGPIGLLYVQLALLAGANPLIVSDPHDEKLRLASRFGADYTIVAREENVLERVRSLTFGRGGDLVVEAVGNPTVWEEAIRLTRNGGRTLLFGGCPAGTAINLDTYRLHYGEMTLTGAFHHTPFAVERAFRLIASKRLKLREMISARMPLERVQEALLMVGAGKAIKVAVTPS